MDAAKKQLYMTTVRVGPKGQIVIPKELRDMFSINVGDNLIIMGDTTKGIALAKQTVLENFADAVFGGKPTDYPVAPNDAENLAKAIKMTTEKGETKK